MVSRLDRDGAAIAGHRDRSVPVNATCGVRVVDFHDQVAAAAIDDVFGLDDMAMHRRHLPVARDQQFFRV